MNAMKNQLFPVTGNIFVADAPITEPPPEEPEELPPGDEDDPGMFPLVGGAEGADGDVGLL